MIFFKNIRVLKKKDCSNYLKDPKYIRFITLNLFVTNSFLAESLINVKPLSKYKQTININCINYRYIHRKPVCKNTLFEVNFKEKLSFKKFITLKLNNIDYYLTQIPLNIINPIYKRVLTKPNYSAHNVIQTLKKKYKYNPVEIKIEKKTFSKSLFLKKKNVFSLMDSQIINFLIFFF